MESNFLSSLSGWLAIITVPVCSFFAFFLVTKMDINRQSEAFFHLKDKWFFRKSSLLIIGFLLMILSDMRGSAGIFAWFVPIPLLIYVTLYRGVKNHLWLLLGLIAGAILTFMKAASVSLVFSVVFALMIGAVIGLRYFLVFLVWGYIRKRAGDFIGIIAFPSLIVILEYFQAFYTPFGDWGSLANTQLYNLPLLQTASLFGFMGISALMSWAAVLLTSIVLKGSLANRKFQLSIFILVLTVLYVFGDLRLDTVPKGKQIFAAGIMSEDKFTGVMPSPDDPEVLQNTDKLIEKTLKAAQSGASIAVWGEGSTMVSEKGEGTFLDTLSELAKTNNISIVAAYAVIRDKEQPFLNKFTWIQNNGEIAETYLKNHPVPGEGSEQGTAPLKVVHTEYGNMAGAICYDYDFPQMALTHARLGADLVVLPGMDWRGMLRRHTLMSRIRAIEGGFSLLRPANGATSMGFDNLGQIRASMTDFGDNDKILLATLPLERTNTLYSRIGNLIAYIAILALIYSLIMMGSNSRSVKK